jgi:pilus assembly protein CpaF
MVLMSGFELPVSAIREQIAAALHLVVQLQRSPDGVRRVVKVSEVTGMESSRVTMQDIYAYEATGKGPDGRLIGRFRASGLRPTFSERLRAHGKELDSSLFLEEGS